MNEIRVLLIEDNPFLRNGIESLLNQQHDINVIKAAADFEHVESLLSVCNKGVVLLDVSLQDQDSLRITEKLHRAALGPVIIVMDLFPTKEEEIYESIELEYLDDEIIEEGQIFP